MKDKEQRRVPIDAALLGLIQKRKEAFPKSRFVIGTRNDTPNWKLLLRLKRRVNAAGLNCGVCQSCMEHDECERWYLHKFRHTYCTKLLRQGIDVKTVQQLAGHSDLTTTMRYLKALGAESVRDRIDAINWGAD